MDKYKSCNGCPDRCADPNCHTPCEGYQFRRARADEDIENRRLQASGLSWIGSEEMERRITNVRDRKARKK